MGKKLCLSPSRWKCKQLSHFPTLPQALQTGQSPLKNTKKKEEEYEKLNKYVDEVFKDLESNYKNAFDAIEKQFNQIFDEINQFEDSLKEVLHAPQTATA